ncbi:MAG TPA: hypothetical protein VH640_02300 [Bryobacteraceae bacterium]
MPHRFRALPAIGALLLFSARSASPNEDDPTNLLLAARQRIMNTIHQLPKYVCTQTVERKRYAPPEPEYGSDGFRRIRSCDDLVAAAHRGAWQPRLSSTDRLRLDVAVTQDSPTFQREMYSWAGENRFSGRDLFDFVPEGAISTGSFASMLLSIFGNPAARFSYRGNSSHDGRALSEFEFHIARANSEYTYVFGPSSTEQVTVAYGGTVLVNPADSDLLRLIVRTEQLPPETGACEVTQEMDYTHVRLHGGDFLLPAQTQVSIIHRDGAQAENRIEYSACHEFQGDSTVRFETPGQSGQADRAADAPVSAPPAVPALSLPPGLPFAVSFPDPIDPAKAAAGDAIHGRLKTAIKDSSGKTLVAAGAPVNGRIMRIQRFYNSARTFMPDRSNAHTEPPPMLVIAIRLETLDAGKGPQPFQTAPDANARQFVRPTAATGVFQYWAGDPDQAVKIIPDSDWFTGAP